MVDAAKIHRSDVSIAFQPWSSGAWLQLIIVIAPALLIPAMANGFPLIFSDTPVYLNVANGPYWPADRSGFYGLYFKPVLMTVEPLFGLWLIAAVQVVLIATVLLLVVRRVSPLACPRAALIVILPIALLTSLPWHAAQLTPDAMTGILILLAWLATSRDLRAPGSALLWLGVGTLALVHYTHIGLLLAVAVTALAAAAWSGIGRREIIARLAAAALVLAAVTASHAAANAATFGRWSVAPMGSLFLFARLNEDGLATRWLDRHCGRDAPAELCDLRSTIQRDSQVLLWGANSPLMPHIHKRIGQSESWRWIEMLDQAALGSIWDEPLNFMRFSVQAGANQFVHFKALDDECPDVCGLAMLDFARSRTNLAAPLINSRQLRGDFGKQPIQALTSTVAIAGLLSWLPLLILAIRRRDRTAISLLVAIAIALVTNALMTGALSDVHDRYQSRLIWLAPFVVLLLAARWQWLDPARPGPRED